MSQISATKFCFIKKLYAPKKLEHHTGSVNPHEDLEENGHLILSSVVVKVDKENSIHIIAINLNKKNVTNTKDCCFSNSFTAR